MHGVEIVELTPTNLTDVPEHCKCCIYWEYPEEFDQGKRSKDDLLAFKRDWLNRVRASFGSCGRIAYVDGIAAGYVQYAVPELLPRIAEYLTGPPSSDAVFISCLFVPQDRYRRRGLGRQLLESILVDLRNRKFGAVETFGRRGTADNPSGPIEFYLKYGFSIVQDDSDFPLLRLDLHGNVLNKHIHRTDDKVVSGETDNHRC